MSASSDDRHCSAGHTSPCLMRIRSVSGKLQYLLKCHFDLPFISGLPQRARQTTLLVHMSALPKPSTGYSVDQEVRPDLRFVVLGVVKLSPSPRVVLHSFVPPLCISPPLLDMLGGPWSCLVAIFPNHRRFFVFVFMSTATILLCKMSWD